LDKGESTRIGHSTWMKSDWLTNQPMNQSMRLPRPESVSSQLQTSFPQKKSTTPVKLNLHDIRDRPATSHGSHTD
jgi:hypothetical protein